MLAVNKILEEIESRNNIKSYEDLACLVEELSSYCFLVSTQIVADDTAILNLEKAYKLLQSAADLIIRCDEVYR